MIEILVGCVPSYSEATLLDWETVAIAGVVYPGLRPARGKSSVGRLYYGLTVADWLVLDSFENPDYTLESVFLESTETHALAYVWRHEVGTEKWNVNDLSKSEISAYLDACKRWRSQYNSPLITPTTSTDHAP